jgi:periplasmic protein TonB
MPTMPMPTLQNTDTYLTATPTLSRRGRAVVLVLLLHAGVFVILHNVMQLTMPAQLIEAVSAHIVTEFKPPELAKPLPPAPAPAKTQIPPPEQPAPPVLPAAVAAPTPLAQAPSTAPTVATAPSTPSLPAIAAHAPAASARAVTVIPASRVDSSCAVPRYPAASERLREEGLVTLRLLISENGQVMSGLVDKSSGYKRLDDAALAALSLCKFKPATVDGKPKQDWSTLRYRWELKDD